MHRAIKSERKIYNNNETVLALREDREKLEKVKEL